MLQMQFKEHAKRQKVSTPAPSKSSTSSSEEEHVLDLRKLGKPSIPSLPPVPTSIGVTIDCFIFVEGEIAYRSTFCKRPVLGEQEVSINDFPSDEFQLIYQIFTERGWEKLTHGSSTPCVEVVREFYFNIAHFNLDEHSLTSTVQGTQIDASTAILRESFELLEVSISRHTEITLERAYFMYALATRVSIDLPKHIIDIIHRSHVEKEKNLPFGSLITKLGMKAKVPLQANEPIMKIPGSISALTVVKFEAILTKKRPPTNE
ncbi:hypothetical protein I3843_02G036100 [Carya illinoinensis]|nr:hypothetical protein I3843_02G036100 [Carya illinoinensis]